MDAPCSSLRRSTLVVAAAPYTRRPPHRIDAAAWPPPDEALGGASGVNAESRSTAVKTGPPAAPTVAGSALPAPPPASMTAPTVKHEDITAAAFALAVEEEHASSVVTRAEACKTSSDRSGGIGPHCSTHLTFSHARASRVTHRRGGRRIGASAHRRGGRTIRPLAFPLLGCVREASSPSFAEDRLSSHGRR